MLMTLMLTMLLSGPMKGPTQMKRCITGCTEITQYGVDVVSCWYDEQARCNRFQVECREDGNIICKPRVTNLGTWDPVPSWYVPAPYVSLTVAP